MIGAIADDFTGATDIAVAFRRAGLRAVVLFNGPNDAELPEHDVAIIALKSRTIEPAEAVRQSVESVEWLRAHGAEQIFFKYCSTFDSRPEGNIGPVADALTDLLDAPRAVFVPSSPVHLRSQYMGHLFVDKLLLSDSHMRHHPLTPMTDSYIPRVLDAQTQFNVSLIDHRDVQQGSDRVATLLADAEGRGERFVVVDAITAYDLTVIGEAVADDVLVTGAAGMAGGLGAAYARRHGLTGAAHDADPLGAVPAAALAGSCSARTLEQIENMRATHPTYQLDALADPDSDSLAKNALAWVDGLDSGSAPLIYSSLPPEQLRQTQEILGTERASEILETAMGIIAEGLVERGVQRLVIAGGETSGAVVTALSVEGGLIGEEAAPGVPWIYTAGERQVALLLKSGNFGDPQLLTRAVETAAA